MRVGRLRAKVIFQARSLSQGVAGDQSAVWTTVLDTWAEVKPIIRGEERVDDQSNRAAAQYEVNIRYPQGVVLTIAHRMVWGTRIFDIRTPPHDADMNQRMLTFRATEGFNNG